MTDPEPVQPTRDTTAVVGGRVIAQIADLLAQVVLFVLLAAVGFSLLGTSFREGWGILLLLLTMFSYNALLEGYWNGQTLGKALLGIRVVGRDGQPPSPGQAAIRSIPALVPIGGTIATIVALISIAATDRRQRVFDTAAETFVVATQSTGSRDRDRHRSESESSTYEYQSFGAN